MIYRKRKGAYDTWHWCKNCSNYPASDYVETTTRPSSDLCNQCKDKEDKKNCS